MAQTKQGAIITAARKIDVSIDEYKQKVQNGLKWCYKCKCWLPNTEFCKDASRWDGLFPACRNCRSIAKGIKRKDLAPSHERQQQVSSAVNYAIKKGLIAKPSMLPCFYCGKKAVEYHHHLGYSDAHIYDVKAVCKKCHINLHWDN